MTISSPNRSPDGLCPNSEYLMAVAMPEGCCARLHIFGTTGSSDCCSNHYIWERQDCSGVVHHGFPPDNPVSYLGEQCFENYFYIRSGTPFTLTFNLTSDC